MAPRLIRVVRLHDQIDVGDVDRLVVASASSGGVLALTSTITFCRSGSSGVNRILTLKLKNPCLSIDVALVTNTSFRSKLSRMYLGAS